MKEAVCLCSNTWYTANENAMPSRLSRQYKHQLLGGGRCSSWSRKTRQPKTMLRRAWVATALQKCLLAGLLSILSQFLTLMHCWFDAIQPNSFPTILWLVVDAELFGTNVFLQNSNRSVSMMYEVLRIQVLIHGGLPSSSSSSWRVASKMLAHLRDHPFPQALVARGAKKGIVTPKYYRRPSSPPRRTPKVCYRTIQRKRRVTRERHLTHAFLDSDIHCLRIVMTSPRQKII